MLVQYGAQRLTRNCWYYHAALLAAALDQRDNLHLVLIAARTLALLAVVAPIGLVHFDRAAARAEQAGVFAGHGLTDAMRHEPCGLIGDAEHVVNLVRADRLLAGAHQMHGHQPFIERNLAALEHGADSDRKLFPAIAALPQARPMRLALEGIVIADATAVRA